MRRVRTHGVHTKVSGGGESAESKERERGEYGLTVFTQRSRAGETVRRESEDSKDSRF